MGTHDSHMTRNPVISCFSLFFLGLALPGCRDSKETSAAPTTIQEVKFRVVQPERLVIKSSQPGRLEAFRRAEVRARVPGIVLNRSYSEGQEVEKGTVLFQIDPAPFRAEFESASAALKEAKAAHLLAKDQKERYTALISSDAISMRDMKEADTAEQQAAARIGVAEAAKETAKLRLDFATVVSPIDGRARRAEVTEGALVGEGAATLLTTVEQIDPIYVNFSQPLSEVVALRRALAEKIVEGIKPDEMNVEIVLGDGTVYSEAGKLIFSDLAVDADTDTVQLRAVVPNPRRELFPGMFVRVNLDLAVEKSAILVPRDALVRTADGAKVMVIGPTDEVITKSVQAKEINGTRWHITEGLSGGERIVVENAAMVPAGSAVKPLAAE